MQFGQIVDLLFKTLRFDSIKNRQQNKKKINLITRRSVCLINRPFQIDRHTSQRSRSSCKLWCIISISVWCCVRNCSICSCKLICSCFWCSICCSSPCSSSSVTKLWLAINGLDCRRLLIALFVRCGPCGIRSCRGLSRSAAFPPPPEDPLWCPALSGMSNWCRLRTPLERPAVICNLPEPELMLESSSSVLYRKLAANKSLFDLPLINKWPAFGDRCSLDWLKELGKLFTCGYLFFC